VKTERKVRVTLEVQTRHELGALRSTWWWNTNMEHSNMCILSAKASSEKNRSKPKKEKK